MTVSSWSMASSIHQVKSKKVTQVPAFSITTNSCKKMVYIQVATKCRQSWSKIQDDGRRLRHRQAFFQLHFTNYWFHLTHRHTCLSLSGRQNTGYWSQARQHDNLFIKHSCHELKKMISSGPNWGEERGYGNSYLLFLWFFPTYSLFIILLHIDMNIDGSLHLYWESIWESMQTRFVALLWNAYLIYNTVRYLIYSTFGCSCQLLLLYVITIFDSNKVHIPVQGCKAWMLGWWSFCCPAGSMNVASGLEQDHNKCT